MSVLGDVGGEIVQDDVGHVGDIQTSSGDCSGNEDGRSTGLEGVESGFSLSLSSITVNRSSSVTLSAQEVAE